MERRKLVTGGKVAKRRSNNALSHGIYAQDLILPFESRKDFKNLCSDLRKEFQPDGRIEEDFVFDIAVLRWQKQRVHKMWVVSCYLDPFVAELIQSGKRSLHGILQFIKHRSTVYQSMIGSLGDHFKEQLDEVVKILAKRLKEGKIKSDAEVKKENENKSSAETKNAQAVRTVLEEFTIPLIKALEENAAGIEELIPPTYSPARLEPIVRLESMIDARIDKAIARLINLKEYKRINANYSPPLIPDDRSTHSGAAAHGSASKARAR